MQEFYINIFNDSSTTPYLYTHQTIMISKVNIFGLSINYNVLNKKVLVIFFKLFRILIFTISKIKILANFRNYNHISFK